MADEPQSYVDWKAERAEKEAEWSQRREVKLAIDFGAAVLSGAASHDLGDLRQVLDQVLLPILLPDGDLGQYHRRVGDHEDWHYGALRMALEHEYPDRKTVIAAFSSCVTIAEAEGIVQGDTDTAVPAHEYEHQIGVRYYPIESGSPKRVDLIDADEELKATLATGGQGSGKSTSIKTVIEDRISRGHTVIDLVDFHKAESGTYDIPQQQSHLREIRKEMGLEPAFGGEYDPPSLEIVAPLSDSLADSRVPMDPTTGRPTLRAFTIPASSLTYRQLVMLLPHTTSVQENYIQSAYQELQRRNTDWTLADLATTVREDTNANDGVSDRLEQSLKRTQQKPYIRDEASDLTLDWDRIMQGTPQVTAFTVHMLEEEADKLALTSYLLDQLYESRKRLIRERRLHDFPPLTAVFRELHSIVPRGKSEQDNERTLEGYMIDSFSELIALMRHVNMEILADTQKFKQQLDSEVAKLFHRVFAFSGQKPDIKEVFRTRVDNTDPASDVAGYGKGECALVSGDGYQMPIQFAPPRSHHVDAKAGEDGLSFRVQSDAVPDEWGPAPWSADIPRRLQFGEVPDGPVERFADQHLARTGDSDDFVTKQAITEAYNAWASLNDEDERSHERIHRRITKVTDFEDGRTRRAERDGRVAVWWGIKLTNDPRPSGNGSGPSGALSDD